MRTLWGKGGAATSARTAFQNPEWLASMIEGAAGEAMTTQPVAVALSDAEGLACVAPFQLRRSHGLVLGEWLGEPLLEFGDVLARDATLFAACWPKILKAMKHEAGADALILRKVRGDGVAASVLGQGGSVQLNALEAPYIPLDQHDDYRVYEATLNAKSRKSRRRARRKLENMGALHFAVHEPGPRAIEAVAQAIAMKVAWLKDRGLASRAFSDAASIHALVETARHPGSGLLVFELSLDGKPIALEIGFVANGRYCSYLGAMEPSMVVHGPGKIQLEDTIRWCFEQGFRSFDLLAPRDDYKMSWTDTTVPVSSHAVPLSMAGWAYTHVYFGMLRPALHAGFHALPAGVRRRVTQTLLGA